MRPAIKLGTLDFEVLYSLTLTLHLFHQVVHASDSLWCPDNVGLVHRVKRTEGTLSHVSAPASRPDDVTDGVELGRPGFFLKRYTRPLEACPRLGQLATVLGPDCVSNVPQELVLRRHVRVSRVNAVLELAL